MTKEQINELKKGDKIKIDTFHKREGRLKGTRIIVNIYDHSPNKENVICVKAFGWDRFQLNSNEIIEKL
tara:strand:+ start:180 stop:386 length:207 start_codon:yes stop_codon:yes gene_type:complete